MPECTVAPCALLAAAWSPPSQCRRPPTAAPCSNVFYCLHRYSSNATSYQQADARCASWSTSLSRALDAFLHKQGGLANYKHSHSPPARPLAILLLLLVLLRASPSGRGGLLLGGLVGHVDLVVAVEQLLGWVVHRSPHQLVVKVAVVVLQDVVQRAGLLQDRACRGRGAGGAGHAVLLGVAAGLGWGWRQQRGSSTGGAPRQPPTQCTVPPRPPSVAKPEKMRT